jgi:tryptophanyl-tRNA synthetase
MSAVTDTGKTIEYNLTKKPGISNLLTIYSLFSGKEIKQLEKEFEKKGYADFKKALVDLLVKELEPFRKKKKELSSREVYVEELLNKGAQRARILAEATMKEVKKNMGLIS